VTAPLPDALIRLNIGGPDAISRDELLGAFARASGEPLSRRVAFWASFFLERGDASYVFGDEPDGYVSRGRLVDDIHIDCVLFVCRVVELATADSPEDALRRALALRFGGASPSDVIRPDGTVDYAHPSRITHGWDLIRGGALGRIVNEDIGDVASDPGTTRIAGGDVNYVPAHAARLDAVRDGDGMFLVLDETNSAAADIRERTGAVVGHMGIARRSTGGVELVHAASHDLPGSYVGGRVVAVSLRKYLDRVERFKGIVVTRLVES